MIPDCTSVFLNKICPQLFIAAITIYNMTKNYKKGKLSNKVSCNL